MVIKGIVKLFIIHTNIVAAVFDTLSGDWKFRVTILPQICAFSYVNYLFFAELSVTKDIFKFFIV